MILERKGWNLVGEIILIIGRLEIVERIGPMMILVVLSP